MAEVYDVLDLYIAPDKFYIEPVGSVSGILSIERGEKQLVRIETNATIIPSGNDVQKRRIYGLVGVIELVAGPYLIVITARSDVGKLHDHPIFRADRLEAIAFPRSETHLREMQVQYNRQYLEMLESSLRDRSFYYSPTFDLSHSQQRLANAVGAASASHPDAAGNAEWRSSSLFERAEKRFVWNGAMLNKLLSRLDDKAPKREVYRFCMPLTRGFVSIQRCVVQSRSNSASTPDSEAAYAGQSGSVTKRQFDLAIISRRAIGRAGVRFFMRGADPFGEVANFVETEQIIVVDDYTFSFVQVRGSIPLFWTQRPNLRYAPPIRFVQLPTDGSDDNGQKGFDEHFKQLRARYGKVVAVDLINHHGMERHLGERFAEAMKRVEASGVDVRYERYDFHRECKQFGWERLHALVARLEPDLDRLGFFLAIRSGPAPRSTGSTGAPSLVVVMDQIGVVRTNCIDCLDRTNVIQSMLARRVAEKQLQRIGVFAFGELIATHATLDRIFRAVWTDNADAISLQYAGTGAMKTDFTRTGKYTRAGKMRDLFNGVYRYFINSFTHGKKQDSLDLLLGNYEVDQDEGNTKICPLEPTKDKKFYYALPVVFLMTFAMILTTINNVGTEEGTLGLAYLMFWATACLGTFGLIMHYGPEYVDQPRLIYQLTNGGLLNRDQFTNVPSKTFKSE